jgi:hypothetical protein
MTEKLPGVLAEIADLVGEAAAIAIAARAGGTRVYIPAKINSTHWLAQAVGLSVAVRLCDHFRVDHRRGQYLEIPLHVGGTYKQYIRTIAERVHKLDAGDEASERKIARQVGITERSVRRHRARHRGRSDGKQGRLL